MPPPPHHGRPPPLHPRRGVRVPTSPHLPALKRLLSPATWIRVAPFASGGHPARSDEPRPTCPPLREASMNMERLPMERHSHRYERMQPEPAPEGDASSSSSCSPSAPARRSEVLAASASFRLSEAMRVFRSSYAPPSSQSHAPTLATSPPYTVEINYKQALQAYGVSVDAVCPGKKGSDACRTAVHQSTGHQVEDLHRLYWDQMNPMSDVPLLRAILVHGHVYFFPIPHGEVCYSGQPKKQENSS